MFYAGAPYCTPSRAGLLTGRLPVRSGMASETRTVLFPDPTGGLPASEVTIPELLKTRGYATAMMGKWHLGPGRSPRGHYGDVIEEIGAGVGRLRAALAELGLERDTLLVFTSDNGPWLLQKEHGGSAGLLRDGKGTTFEGGVRVPALFLWPGTVKPGVVLDMGAAFDLLPTFAAVAAAALPTDRVFDGHDLTPVLRGTGRSPRRTYFYYRGPLLQAVRSGPYKVHYFTRPDGHDIPPEPIDPPWLYNLDQDPSERYDIAREHPEIAAELRRLAEEHKRTVVPVEDQIAKRAPAGR